ncbi:MAG: pirin family protein [Chloroflexi bacterium]|nr:pirin family protein [Chloroflexota bacterium]
MPPARLADAASLPRVAEPSTGRERPVLGVSTAPHGLEGEGFPVRRAFAGIDLRYLDPFIMMDQIGEVEWAVGEAKGTPWHPHRGFETVTYLLEGGFRHEDSHGGGGIIGEGDTQWMTAGGGILHIEAPTEQLLRAGGVVHGIQLWVNLPKAQKWADPRYQDIAGGQLGLAGSADGGALIRVIAGDLGGHRGPGITHTPISLVHLTIPPGARVHLPWPAHYNALAYVLAGRGFAGAERWPMVMGQAAVFGDGDSVSLVADTTQEGRAPNLELLLLGGQPIREPVAWAGPFVMNSEDEVRQAFADFRAGRLGRDLPGRLDS